VDRDTQNVGGYELAGRDRLRGTGDGVVEVLVIRESDGDRGESEQMRVLVMWEETDLRR